MNNYIMTYVHLRGGVILDNKNGKRKTQYVSKRPPTFTDRKAQRTNRYT